MVRINFKSLMILFFVLLFSYSLAQEKGSEKPQINLDKETGKVSVDYYKKLDSDSARVCWLEKGGFLISNGITGNYTYSSMDEEGVEFTMNGFGVSYMGALKFISPPDYEKSKNIWTAFTGGLAVSANYMTGEMSVMDMELLAIDASIPVGYTFGLGKYFSRSDWKGVMLALFWKPTYSYNASRSTIPDADPFNPGEDWVLESWDDSFNMKGFQWSVDWGSFSDYAESLAQEAHLTINGFILPETDSTPFMFSIGVGAVWY